MVCLVVKVEKKKRVRWADTPAGQQAQQEQQKQGEFLLIVGHNEFSVESVLGYFFLPFPFSHSHPIFIPLLCFFVSCLLLQPFFIFYISFFHLSSLTLLSFISFFSFILPLFYSSVPFSTPFSFLTSFFKASSILNSLLNQSFLILYFSSKA